MDEISRKLALLKKQINNYKVVIERNQGQIANLNTQIDNLKLLRANLIKNHPKKENE
jgi:hypothetical protein